MKYNNKLFISEDYIINLNKQDKHLNKKNSSVSLVLLQENIKNKILDKNFKFPKIKTSVNEDFKIKINSAISKKSLSKYKEEIIDIVKQSKYIRLLEDNTGMLYLRHNEDLEDEDEKYKQETLIKDYILNNFPLLVSYEFNSGMSKDINKIVISIGKEAGIE